MTGNLSTTCKIHLHLIVNLIISEGTDNTHFCISLDAIWGNYYAASMLQDAEVGLHLLSHLPST